MRAFEQALESPTERDAMQRAIALYRGDFLPSAPLSATLWADTRRAHLQQRYLNALEQLAQSAERDAPHMAIHYYQQVLQIDGCRERTATQLMRLAARFGNGVVIPPTLADLPMHPGGPVIVHLHPVHAKVAGAGTVWMCGVDQRKRDEGSAVFRP